MSDQWEDRDTDVGTTLGVVGPEELVANPDGGPVVGEVEASSDEVDVGGDGSEAPPSN